MDGEEAKVKPRKLTPEQLASLRMAQQRMDLAREYWSGLMTGLGLDLSKNYNISDAGEVSEVPAGPQFG